jgi:hypothetical protein
MAIDAWRAGRVGASSGEGTVIVRIPRDDSELIVAAAMAPIVACLPTWSRSVHKL